LTVMPASCATLTAAMASSLGGSKIAIIATITRDGGRFSSAAGLRPVGDSSGERSPLVVVGWWY
jgi:hypothetical protein